MPCCNTSTAPCLACKEGITKDEYCNKHPSTIGCQSHPDAQTTMFDVDGWTSIHSHHLVSPESLDRRVKINAMKSATTEQELYNAIEEAKSANVSHIIINQQARRLSDTQLITTPLPHFSSDSAPSKAHIHSREKIV